MTTTNLNIRMDKSTKDQAEAIFNELGITMTTAINMFFKQTIRRNGIPFELTVDVPNRKTIKALKEAEKIARDPNAKSYTVEEAFRELAK